MNLCKIDISPNCQLVQLNSITCFYFDSASPSSPFSPSRLGHVRDPWDIKSLFHKIYPLLKKTPILIILSNQSYPWRSPLSLRSRSVLSLWFWWTDSQSNGHKFMTVFCWQTFPLICSYSASACSYPPLFCHSLSHGICSAECLFSHTFKTEN